MERRCPPKWLGLLWAEVIGSALVRWPAPRRSSQQVAAAMRHIRRQRRPAEAGPGGCTYSIASLTCTDASAMV